MYTPNCRKITKNMIINIDSGETYYENEWKEINLVLLGTAVLAMVSWRAAAAAETTAAGTAAPAHRGRDRCKVFCCVRGDTKTQKKQQRQRECPVR